ncbi:MAG: 3-keto-disaccharide hydrolase [Planctomycetota bacterium]|jgi:hypothetical protein
MRLLLLLGSSLFLLQDPTPRPGYDDTPVIPGQTWRVHDKERPYPQVVTPGKTATDAPADATVLFDGTSLDAWTSADGKAPAWKVEDGAMVVSGGGDLQTKQTFGDCQLHVEWATPADRSGGSQGMGNSGVFLMGLYEIQVLDTFDNPSYADGTAAAVYGQFPPDVNACRPSGQWQSYDILFRAPRFDAEGLRTEPARITVLHNGVAVHVDRTLLGPTRHRALPTQDAHAASLPLKLQDHGDAVRYRNIWIRPLP